jgi:hypothetical protein
MALKVAIVKPVQSCVISTQNHSFFYIHGAHFEEYKICGSYQALFLKFKSIRAKN